MFASRPVSDLWFIDQPLESCTKPFVMPNSIDFHALETEGSCPFRKLDSVFFSFFKPSLTVMYLRMGAKMLCYCNRWDEEVILEHRYMVIDEDQRIRSKVEFLTA